jgi:hypothetical protein
MSHTKGPWQAKPPRIGAAITIYGADGEFPVATTCSNTSPATMQAHRDGTVAANARLIAAAPELLEALKALYLARQQDKYRGWEIGVPNFEEAERLADAAIAKAEQQ